MLSIMMSLFLFGPAGLPAVTRPAREGAGEAGTIIIVKTKRL